MKTRCLSLAALLMLAVAPYPAGAQASAPSPDFAASPPPAAKLGPRLLTPAESRDSATPPGGLRPERPVTPQISIPLGKKPPAPLTSESSVPPSSTAPSASGIDNAAARCEAQRGEQVRAKCRDRLARETRSRRPD